MRPSSIHYLTSDLTSMATSGVDQDLVRKVAETGDLPKIQVVHKDGHWFTLNNSQLDLCRNLEEVGSCSKVRADIVPLTQIPPLVRKLMAIPPANPGQRPDSQGTAVTGKARLETYCPHHTARGFV